ncbi:hypothetical protein P7H15_26265 [Paenibacillus larvae]|nr:hypothetical protein [Paenibacillus larvae]MDT2295554.1 hypothetical protein [Paenibacillus larvae]MDT2295622.1 hypothetical protein [Paenibacillus larvae]
MSNTQLILPKKDVAVLNKLKNIESKFKNGVRPECPKGSTNGTHGKTRYQKV